MLEPFGVLCVLYYPELSQIVLTELHFDVLE